MILVLGASGQLGSAVYSRAPEGTLGTCYTAFQDISYSVLDVTDVDQVWNSLGKEIKYIINCAALVGVKKCARDKGMSRRVNYEAVRNLVHACNDFNIKLVHISSPAVFAGNIGGYQAGVGSSATSVYGTHKAMADKYIRENSEDYLIIRGDFFSCRYGLVKWLEGELSKGRMAEAWTNSIFSPVHVSTMAETILGNKDMAGTLHVASTPAISKYNFCRMVAQKLGYDATRVHPVRQTIADYGSNTWLVSSVPDIVLSQEVELLS